MSSTIASYKKRGGGAYVHRLPTMTCSVGAVHERSLSTQVLYDPIFWHAGQVTGPVALPLGRVSYGCRWRPSRRLTEIRASGIRGCAVVLSVAQPPLTAALCKAALARNRTLAQRFRSTSVASSPQQHRAASQRRSSGSSQSAILPKAASLTGSVGVGGS